MFTFKNTNLAHYLKFVRRRGGSATNGDTPFSFNRPIVAPRSGGGDSMETVCYNCFGSFAILTMLFL